MPKIKLPILVHSGLKPVVTQPYADTKMVDFYKSKGINIPFHNGVDIVLSGTNRQTYGTALISPGNDWTIRAKYTYDDAMSKNGNGIVIHSPGFIEDGKTKKIELRMVHLSEVTTAEGKLYDGQIIGYLGNSGLVSPTPTPDDPYAGVHLHLGACIVSMIDGKEVVDNFNNGVYGMIDPLSLIDITWYDTAPDTPVEKDAPPLKWGIDTLGLKEVWEKVIYVFKVIFTK